MYLCMCIYVHDSAILLLCTHTLVTYVCTYIICIMYVVVLSRASQNNKLSDIPKPITTQTGSNTALPAVNETYNINNSTTFNSSTSNSSISSSREANGVIEDLSSLNIQSSNESNVTTITSNTSSNSELTADNCDASRTGHSKYSDTGVLHKYSSDDTNKAVSDSVVLERHGSDDSNILTTKCPHQQQNRSKENVTLPHNKGQHQQSKSGSKGSKKSKKNTNVSHEKLKHTGTGPHNVGQVDGMTSDPFKVENSTTKPAKENVPKTAGSHNKKKKNKDNVAHAGGVVPHEQLTVAKSESSIGVDHRSSSTGVKAPPPGLTKQPSHTNAVNGRLLKLPIQLLDGVVMIKVKFILAIKCSEGSKVWCSIIG